MIIKATNQQPNKQIKVHIIEGAGGQIEEIKLASAAAGAASNYSHHGSVHKT